jgi:tRNA pseudouridine55 synthase
MNGIIVIDKPGGKTSYDVIRQVKRILRTKRVGHTGTLDPLATGVLPLCLNEATKLARFFFDDDKEYLVTMRLGVRTDTLDADGQIISDEKPRCSSNDVEEALMNCVGRHEQAPPCYSAVKYKGKPLYKWAREGVNIDLPPRDVEIFAITIGDISLPYATFRLSCSKGTYIRTLCADVGDRLGCGACVAQLRRTRSGRFEEGDAVSLSGDDEKELRERLREHFIPLDDAMPHIPSIPVDPVTERTLRQGCQPVVEVFENSDISSLNEGDLIKFKSRGNNLVAIAKMHAGGDVIPLLDRKTPVARLVRVFNG